VPPVGLPFNGRAGLVEGGSGLSFEEPDDATEQGDEADKARQDRSLAAYPQCWADAGGSVTANRKAQPAREGSARGTSWQRLCVDGLKLPGVEEGISYRTPALFVRKKLLARLREDGETVAIGVDPLDRDLLLEADPKAFFLTDHYRGYPWVLMRLASVRHGAAMELLEQAWRRAAPAGLAGMQSRRSPSSPGSDVGESRLDPTGRRTRTPRARRRRPTRG
jgi:hypothetical protein